ncbi:MAG TPA: helix-hairpin-helix domain-containing protein [Chlamydiales bacterium]|nr:helix-hairpin-helix domain-containing protein [Chlamydiales bacterium]
MAKKRTPPQTLSDLVSVGPATLADFEALGIRSLEELALQDACDLYGKLCRITNTQQDPCVEDVFQAAIEQAKNPHLAGEKKNWFYWSRKRKTR